MQTKSATIGMQTKSATIGMQTKSATIGMQATSATIGMQTKSGKETILGMETMIGMQNMSVTETILGMRTSPETMMQRAKADESSTRDRTMRNRKDLQGPQGLIANVRENPPYGRKK
jgi:hypothetical protein